MTDTVALTRLSPSLWLDLREVVAVSTETSSRSYARLVHLTLRNGTVHTLRLTSDGGTKPAAQADAKRDEWLRTHLGALLGIEESTARTAEAEKPEPPGADDIKTDEDRPMACGPHCGEDMPGVTIHCRAKCCHG